MAKTKWQDPKTSEIRSTHVSGLQEAVGKLENSVVLDSKAEADIPLTEIYIASDDRYRIFQAPEGKRNWVESPAPVIKMNGNEIVTGFEIDYGGGAVILHVPILSGDVLTADATYTEEFSLDGAVLYTGDIEEDEPAEGTLYDADLLGGFLPSYFAPNIDGNLPTDDKSLSGAITEIKGDHDALAGVVSDNSDILKFTATNLLDNGDFASETSGVATGWTKGSAITGVSVLNNTQFFTGAGALSASSNNRFSQAGKITEAGRWYYLRISAKKVSGAGDTLYMGTGEISRLECILEGDFKDYSIVFQAKQADPTSFALGAQSGLAVAVQYALALDVTDIFDGRYVAGSAEMDEFLALHKNNFFDGTTQLAGLKDVYALNADKRVKIYGAKFVGSNAEGERTHDAVGMIAECGVDDQLVRNDFDGIDFYQRPRCNIYHDANGNPIVMAYEGEPGFNLEGAVFPPYVDIASVFYECKPCAWNGSYEHPQVTGTPLEGFELFECFPDWNTKVYFPSYWMATVNGKATSVSGTWPGYYSLNSAMTAARTYHINGHTETMAARMYEYILQIIEFATRDVQLKMMGASSMSYNSASTVITDVVSGTEFEVSKATGAAFVAGQTISIGSAQNGEQRTARVIIADITTDESASTITLETSVAGLTIGDFLSTRAWRNGATDIVQASSGSPVSNTDAKHPCIWRGKVDPWANALSVICDLLIERTGTGAEGDPYIYTPYYLPDPTKYDAGAITADYIKIDLTLPTVDGYAKNLETDRRYRHIGLPTLLGASNATWLAAYYYYPRYAICVAFVGGHWHRGRDCSPVCFLLYAPPGSSYVSYLARLFCTPE